MNVGVRKALRERGWAKGREERLSSSEDLEDGVPLRVSEI